MTKQNQQNQMKEGRFGVGAAALALAAAAAGAYFLYGSKDALKNRKKVKGWMLKAKGEVLEGMEKMKDNITEESYYRLIEAVVAKYASVKNSSSKELNTLEKELKSHWKNIKKHLNFKPVVKKPKSRKNKKNGTAKN